MNSHDYLFPIPEIEQLILNYLDLMDFKNLLSINKYFNDIIVRYPSYHIYLEFKKFCLCKDGFRIYNMKKANKSQTNFFKACRYGYLEIAKFLLKNYPNEINLFADFEYAFQTSCENGRLEVAMWLYSLSQGGRKFDIHLYHDRALYISVYNGHLEVHQWLSDLIETKEN